MRISELARATGTSVPTLKFYLREGLLPPGTVTARNQAHYGDVHVHRLHLIRALTEVGGLSLEATRNVLAAVEDPSLSIHNVFGVAQRALHRPAARVRQPQHLDEAQREVDAYLRDLGWRVKPDAPARQDLAGALVLLRDLGWTIGPQVFDVYARAADGVARWEIEQTPGSDAPADVRVEGVVVGTIVFEAVLAALRRLALEHHSAEMSEPAPRRTRRRAGGAKERA